MHLEIKAAVNFLVKILGLKKTMKPHELDALGKHLVCILCDKYQGHWYPDMPARGQAFRCIRINAWQYADESLLQACGRCGIEYTRLPLPEEITLWIDPFDVCGRFGEHTDHFTIATFEHFVVTAPVLDYTGTETSDYSSGGPSSVGSTSESSSDDETSGEKAIDKDEPAPDEAFDFSPRAGSPVVEVMDSEKMRCCTGSEMDETGAMETRVLLVGNGS
ncbi:protein BTG3-like isoform X2 [Bufo bufo]|nr:protein BTG3-like isoform X2 [Bufo bufo]XP_040276350.1 protein BTG3-like isoform X2 [Bufo bufo]XP_040276357.1 protein BTG3-like isoform X2 [Bufo bufo]XP_040276361.1 protein BTG3-like isoform X2 [Bufo bufo]XP_040276364.1 protein BTG3-like isoform X2 [Bufo bufo]XP_040276371.1 protein BTG3-like isoform X2 [Bufo bufo]XP_040276377.1 protein BTG3-like isoform X2 [Bufo bufo]XP_040276384.1 protein BTG3-like isoform X2 [Bufo bufo]